jgi:peptide/nickel transport system permease protein
MNDVATPAPVEVPRGPVARAEPGASPWAIARRRFFGHRQAMLGLVVLVVLGLLSLLSPVIAPLDPSVHLANRLQAPGAANWLGTDDAGYDMFRLLLAGSRVSLLIGFLSVAIAITLGTVIGAVAGYAGGWADAVLMRIVDLFLSVPRLVLLITAIALLRPSIPLIVVVLGLTGWMGVARLVRGQVLAVREREHVLAARALGYRPLRILFRHILPNVLTPGGAQLPGPRRAAARHFVGPDHLLWPGPHARRVVDHGLSGNPHRSHGDGVQPGR